MMTAMSSRIEDFDDPTFDPFLAYELSHGAEAVDDPHPRIHALRSQGSVHEGGFRAAFGAPVDVTLSHMPHYTIYGLDAVSRVLFDHATYSNKLYENNIGRGFGRSITVMDPPEHTKFRRLFQKVFLPRQIAAWGENFVKPVVNRLIDEFIDRGEAELVREFTIRYPFQFIYHQLGLPPHDVDIFQRLAAGLMCVSTDIQHGMEANRKMGVYFEHLLVECRRHPGDDLVSQLAQAEMDGEHLPDEIIVAFLRQLLNAGGDTTFRASGTTLVGLLRRPEQLAAVQANRSLLPAAIQEGLRWDTPTTAILRSPVRDVEIDGVAVPAGAALDVVIASANRDPAVYPDPDTFDIYRAAGRQMTFGFGPHICIGQHLARLEMEVALNTLLERLPRLRLDERQPAPRIVGLTKRAPDHLYVRFD